MQLGGYFSGAPLMPIVIARTAAMAHGSIAIASGADEHAPHHMPPDAAPAAGATRSTNAYVIPNVYPATLIRAAPGAPWTRLDGFATADQLLAELSNLSQLHAAR